MARDQNFLLGNGERLAAPVRIDRASGPKNPPYTFAQAKKRIGQQLVRLVNDASSLPVAACPRDEVVAVVTMHPRYLSKSDFPKDLFSTVGVRAVGSRSREVKPEKWGVEKHPESAISEDIFIAGTRSALKRWNQGLPQWDEKRTSGAKILQAIEQIELFGGSQKIKGIPAGVDDLLLEVVLHSAETDAVIVDFSNFVESLGGELHHKARRSIDGLTFVPVQLKKTKVPKLAEFSFVRVVRGMPTLRPLRPTPIRSSRAYNVEMPTNGVLSGAERAVIFDGGIPKNAQSALKNWVTYIDPPGVGLPLPNLEQHGLGVTTSFLFGNLKRGQPPGLPLCAVDHVRVLDAHTGAANDIHYFDVLDRITAHLDANPNTYKYINISLGPRIAVDDNDVTLWTSSLDRRFAHGRYVATVAVGNDGLLDAAAGLNRIQPPADGVNVLSVGASDSNDANWNVADYSCRGPGRSPGLVKPDGVVFGGSDKEGFGVLLPNLTVGDDSGTSFAAPLALRAAAAIGTQIGSKINPLSIRGLMIHRAQMPSTASMRDVGWGRFQTDPLALITCEDNEALTLYQGELPLGEHLRVAVPLPKGNYTGDIEITATLLVAPDVDPQHPSAYTRSGLEVVFRPHNTKKKVDKKTGQESKHPVPKPFFSEKLLYGESEYVLRQDGHKWEPCLKSNLNLKATNLSEPCFDIYYHHREGAGKASNPQPIPYAFIVNVSASEVPDLYNRVVRAYSHVLVPLKPRVKVQVRTGR